MNTSCHFFLTKRKNRNTDPKSFFSLISASHKTHKPQTLADLLSWLRSSRQPSNPSPFFLFSSRLRTKSQEHNELGEIREVKALLRKILAAKHSKLGITEVGGELRKIYGPVGSITLFADKPLGITG